MTVKECLEIVLSFEQDRLEDNNEMRKFGVTWCNMLLADCMNYENVFRRVHGLPELSVPPKVSNEYEEIPYNERLVSAAFPYGMAKFYYLDEDGGGNEFYQRYVIALSEATPLETVEIEDVYG